MWNTIDEAIIDLKHGKSIIVCDNEDRENEGDLVALAELITDETVNFMITHAKGLICTPISQDIAKSLNLNSMVRDNQDNHGTAFTASIDHITNTTGISANERATTIRALANLSSVASDFRSPGHMFPLIAQDGGVLMRAGHTEAAVDLAKLCGSVEAGVICEIINPDGTMARVTDLLEFRTKHNLKMIHIKDLLQYRKTHESWVKLEASTNLPTKYGIFEMQIYKNIYTTEEVICLTNNEYDGVPLVRIHSECITSEVFGSLKCDCADQLSSALGIIGARGGVLFYLHQEGRGIGLINKIKAYKLQEDGFNTIEANQKLSLPVDARDYYMVAQVLKQNGIDSVNLLTNNPDKIKQLTQYGIIVDDHTSLITGTHELSQEYIQVKKSQMGHLFN